RILPRRRLASCAQDRLRRKDRELSVAVFFEEPHAVAAAQEILNLSGHGREGGLRLQQRFQVGSVFALADGETVGVFLPGRANIVAMAKQALVALHMVGNRLAGVILSPSGRIETLLRRAGAAGILPAGRR